MTGNKDNMYSSRQFLNLPSKTSPASLRTEIVEMQRYSMEFRDCHSMVCLHGSLDENDERESFENFLYKCTMIVEEVTKLMDFAIKRNAELKGKRKRGIQKKTVKIYDRNNVCYDQETRVDYPR